MNFVLILSPVVLMLVAVRAFLRWDNRRAASWLGEEGK